MSTIDGPSSDCVQTLLAATRALVAIAARSLADVERDLSLVQYRALVVLTSRGAQRSGDLARELGIKPSSCTGLCDRLAAKGLIDRNAVPTNRREVIVSATPKAQRIVRGVMRRRQQELERVVAQLTPAQRRSLTQTMRTFASLTGEEPGDEWRLGWVG